MIPPNMSLLSQNVQNAPKIAIIAPPPKDFLSLKTIIPNT